MQCVCVCIVGVVCVRVLCYVRCELVVLVVCVVCVCCVRRCVLCSSCAVCAY